MKTEAYRPEIANIEHGSESHSVIGDILENNNDGERNKEIP